MWLTRFALTRPTITIAIFAALVIFGVISFVQLGRSSSPPNTDFPVVAVFASYPGASPQDMERMVIKPIEDQMSGIDHLDPGLDEAKPFQRNVGGFAINEPCAEANYFLENWHARFRCSFQAKALLSPNERRAGLLVLFPENCV